MRMSSLYDKEIHTEQYCNFVGERKRRGGGEMGKSVDKNVILQQLGIIYESKRERREFSGLSSKNT